MRALVLLVSLLFWALLPAARAETPALEPSAALVTRAAAGDAEAAEALGLFYIEGGEAPRDSEAALRWFRVAADAGRPDSMFWLSQLLLRSSGDPVAHAEAEALFQRAFELGARPALLQRGADLILKDEDFDAGLALLQRARGPLSVGAIGDVASYYDAAANAPPERARALIRLAAEEGDAESQWRYAMQLREGRGGPLDLQEAYQWAHRAAEAGYLQGLISTAVMLATGEGVAENDAEARVWYQRAAERNSAHALRSLGGMYLSGEGGPVDMARGWGYVMLGAEGGDEIAVRHVQTHGASIPEEILRAAGRVRLAWIAEHGAPH